MPEYSDPIIEARMQRVRDQINSLNREPTDAEFQLYVIGALLETQEKQTMAIEGLTGAIADLSTFLKGNDGKKPDNWIRRSVPYAIGVGIVSGIIEGTQRLWQK